MKRFEDLQVFMVEFCLQLAFGQCTSVLHKSREVMTPGHFYDAPNGKNGPHKAVILRRNLQNPGFHNSDQIPTWFKHR
jgi:hypothetical protein